MPTRVLTDAELAQLTGYPGEVGAQDLTTFFRLDGDARRWVLTSHRGAPNQLGLALQVTRLPGRQAPKPLCCGGHASAPSPPGSTAAGRPSCAASILSTPSGCSSRPSAGPHRRSATRKPPTAEPG